MSNKYTILALLAGISLLLSFSANPPDGRTGAPGDGLCSDCHSLGGGMQDGSISVSGLPAVIIPNTAYVLTVTNSNPNGLANLAGFQLTILNSNNTIAGVISNPSAGSTTSMSGGRQYWDHNPAQSYPMSNVVMWTATWTSPNMPPNTTITAYVAGNIANGNGSNSGDLIDTDVQSGMLMGGGSSLAVTITSSQDPLCFGENSGSATATATGGTTPYTYNWSNGASGPTASNLGAGTYTVTVTDNASATATASVTLTEPAELDFNNPVINNVTCNGGSNGSISVTATGGVNPYFYNWSNGMTGSSITNLTAGSYTVTVTDDNSCTATSSYTVTQPAMININLVDLNHETCAGEEDGSITISVTGGVNPIFAEWSNGSIGFTINDLAPDTYSVTVTDNNDCTQTATYTINAGGTIDVDLLQLQHVTCFGGTNGAISINATGGVPPYTYDWSNGMTGSSITGLAAGNYLVTVSDLNGCEVVELYTVNQPAEITIAISQSSQNLCFGDTIADLVATVSGGTPGYTASWSNGETGLMINNLAGGTYTITVTDASGCTATSSAIISQPPLLGVTVVTTDETSAGANDGTATATPAGGTPGYTYVWNNGATTSVINGLAPGTYSVTVTDTNGCTATGSGQVDAFGCNVDVMLGLDQVICEDDTLVIIPTVTGATGLVTYIWSDGTTGDSLLVFGGGTYCVSITDEGNCQDADCVTITENIIPSLDCPVTNESVPGANDGAINCEGLMGFVSFLWSNGATTPSISGLPPGQYCVTVTDTLGCTKVQCFNVQSGSCQMTITPSQMNVACAGDSSGVVTLTVTGATDPVTYQWSSGATGSSSGNLPAGNYIVIVMDAAGCVDTLSFIITEPPALSLTIDSIKPIDDTGPGLIHVTVAGGTSPYSYLWSFPGGGSSNSQDLDGLTVAGYYSLLVTDAAGCTLTMDSIFVDMEVAVDPSPNINIIKVYPVPADDILFIESDEQITEVIITGIDGRTLRRIEHPLSNRIDVGDLEVGWYVLRIAAGEKWHIARLVK